MSENETLEEKRAAILIKYRKLKIDRIEREGDLITYHLSKGDEKYVMLCILKQKTIGIDYVRSLRKLIEEEEAVKGIIVGDGKYTYSARSSSLKMDIELVPPTLPAFDIFQHELVPKHEILSEKERKKVIERLHAKPYQFPWIKSSDPVAIILGAVPGDILKIMIKSSTAGTAESYRYVIN